VESSTDPFFIDGLMQEVIVNLHMHTRYSDGAGSHGDIARAAVKSGLDAVIITDHNVLVEGVQRYVGPGRRKVLILAGEEVHDRTRVPQKDHMLILGCGHEVAAAGADPDALAKAAADGGGVSFIAHLHDPAAPAFREPDISWENWSIGSYTGIELWNGLSELKSLVPTRLHGIFYAFFPHFLAHAPPSTTLKQWDLLLRERRIVAIGGSDAHASPMHLGPLQRIIYPYEHHFRCINTHVLLSGELTGDPIGDGRQILDAIASGHCFVGYDLPSPTRGFRFTAHGGEGDTVMGDELRARGSVTLQTHLPSFAEIRLMHDGRLIRRATHVQALTYTASQPGVYRIEVYRRYLGRRRGWIFSNPIYIR
jgi:hypothetical protein